MHNLGFGYLTNYPYRPSDLPPSELNSDVERWLSTLLVSLLDSELDSRRTAGSAGILLPGAALRDACMSPPTAQLAAINQKTT